MIKGGFIFISWSDFTHKFILSELNCKGNDVDCLQTGEILDTAFLASDFELNGHLWDLNFSLGEKELGFINDERAALTLGADGLPLLVKKREEFLIFHEPAVSIGDKWVRVKGE
jgi:hypothetical protein